MSRIANKPVLYVYYTFDDSNNIVGKGIVKARSKSHVAEWLRRIDVQPATPEDVAELMTQGYTVQDIFESDEGDDAAA